MSRLDDLPLLTDEELSLCTPDELADIEAMYETAFAQTARDEETDWRHWLPWLFPTYFTSPFAAHHEELWEWLWSIELGEKPDNAFVAVWPRGGAKSSSAEAGVVALAARGRRRYGLLVCETQPQADDHVGNVASMLESRRLGIAYPELGERLVGKFGSSKGWRRNRLRTANGFTIDALGLDVAARGLRLDEDRPDLLIFDDLDSHDDGPGQVQRKIEAITKKLLPAGSDDLAVLAIQNLVNPEGVFARLAGLAEEPADFLTNRIVSGPIPALEDATFEAQDDGSWQIITGRPTWEGQDLERCQENVDEWGITAFKTEAQHDTDARGGGMFDHVIFQHCERDAIPALVRVEVWVDPAVTTTDNSDSMAIQCDGLAANGTIYRLRSWEHRASPVDALGLAIAWGFLEGALRVGVETDQGGDTWRSVYKEALGVVNADIALIRAGEVLPVRRPEYVAAIVELAGRDDELPDLIEPFFAEEKAGSTQMPKAHRIQQMLPDYEKAGRIVHVLGTHAVLERALFRFPARKPFDLCLAADTMIATPTGDVPIQTVRPGDLVMTRSGARHVLHVGLTNPAADRLRVPLEDGRHLDGTAAHPVWSVQEQGWRPLGDLRCDDMVLVCTSGSDQTSYGLMASSTDASNSAAELLTSPSSVASSTCSTTVGRITRRSGRALLNAMPSIAIFGRRRTGRSPTATSSTMSTSIRSTTRSTTSPASHTPSTERSTANRWNQSGSARTWPRSKRKQPSGIAAPKVGNGIGSTERAPGTGRNRARSSVLSVARRFSRASPDPCCSALRPAATPSQRATPTTTSTGSVLVAQPSPLGSGTVRPTAAVRVQRAPELLDVGPVFNLTVDEVPEFFANGILVHNCDAAYWGWHALRLFGQPTRTSSKASRRKMPQPQFGRAQLQGRGTMVR